MTMSENEVVMALSQKVATLERRLDTVAKLHMALAEKYEHLLGKCNLMAKKVMDLEDCHD